MTTIDGLVPDTLWQAIQPLLPAPAPRYGGRPRVEDRAALVGIVYQLRTGIPRRLPPTRQLGGGCATGSAPACGGGCTDAVPPVKGPRGRPGRPRKRPAKLHGDKGYDYPRCRRALRRRGSARGSPGVASSPASGWAATGVVERSLAWLVGYRRLQVRYKRRADILLGFCYLACALLCRKSLQQPEA